MVFNSGPARKAPDDLPPAEGRKQLVEFSRRFAREAGKHKLTVLLQPLRSTDTNQVTTVAEAVEVVRAVGQPNFKLLTDWSFMHIQKDDAAELAKARGRLAHVWLAKPGPRTYPITEDAAEYEALFAALSKIRYRGGSERARPHRQLLRRRPGSAALSAHPGGRTRPAVAARQTAKATCRSLWQPRQCYKDCRSTMPTRSSLILFMGVVAGMLVGLAGPARAAEDPAALVQQAKNLRLAGDDEGAYKLYLRAHNLAKSPETAAHLGMAEINLALWVDAENHLREALKKPNDPFVARNRVPIVEQLKLVRTHLGLLEVVGRPSGAEVEVGGKPVGRLPLPGPLRVPTGETNIRVAADGHKVARRDVTVQPGQLHRIAVELDPVGAPEPPPPVARGGARP